MTSQKELKVVTSVAVILFVVGVFCYAAYSAKPPDEPLRVYYPAAAGNVLFLHKDHVETYNADCLDCHHHPGDDSGMMACGECHPKTVADGDPPPEACLGCHELDDIKDQPPMARADAFHKQCGDCHQGIGAGPPAADCAGCHYL